MRSSGIHTLKSILPLVTPNDIENHIKRWSLVANKIFDSIITEVAVTKESKSQFLFTKSK